MLPSKILDDARKIRFKAFSNTMGDTGVKASMVYVDLDTLPKTEGVRDYLGYYLDNRRYDDGELFDGMITSDKHMSFPLRIFKRFPCLMRPKCFFRPLKRTPTRLKVLLTSPDHGYSDLSVINLGDIC